MKEEKAQALLAKYLRGEASPAEKKLVDEWYNTIGHESNADAELKRIAGARIKLAIEAQTKPIRKVSLFGNWIKVAAAVIVFALAGLWLTQSDFAKSELDYVVISSNNEAKQFQLADGTTVSLEAHSILKYPKQFNNAERKVFLEEGQAFFDVHHDEQKQFSVATKSGLSIVVLGTSFLVKSFAKQSDVEVQVSTGRVAVNHSNKTLGVLGRGDKLIFNKSSNSIVSNQKTAVKVVPIEFEASTIKQVASKLAYAYGVKMTVDSSVNPKLKTTAKFNSGQSISEILNLICKLHQVRYRISADHKTYTIYK